jgi:tetratricopeptide (TPR) repeat protein
MVTLSTYSNAVEAAMAKSLLDNHDIFCRLADENVHLYGGGPLAMPIRLLVAEDQAQEASRILKTKGPELSEDFDPGTPDERASQKGDINHQIMSELRGLRHTSQWIALIAIAILIIVVYFVSELPRRVTTPWSKVEEAMDKYDYTTALTLAKKNLAQHPEDYYGHTYLGSIYFEIGDLDRAEAEYVRAEELSPRHYLQERLKEVRERRARKSRAQPSATGMPSG